MSALLSSDASYCDVEVSTDTNEAEERGLFACDQLLRFHLESYIQSTGFVGSYCYWLTARVLRILPTYDLSIALATGSMLSLRNDSGLRHLRSFDRPIVLYDRKVHVAFASLPSQPRVLVSVISHPLVGAIVDISHSTGDCGWLWRSCQVLMSLSQNSGVNTTALSMALVTSVTGAVQWSNVGVTYPDRLNVTLCNVLNQCGQGDAAIIAIASGGSSTIGMVVAHHFPAVPELTVTVNTSLVFRGTGTYISPGVSLAQPKYRHSHLNYTWYFGERGNVSRVSNVNWRSRSSNPQVFRLPPYVLVPGQVYELYVSVVDCLTLVEGRSRSTIITSRISPLVAVLLPSQEKLLLAAGESLQLNGSLSYDPDKPRSSRASSLRLVWSCDSADIPGQECSLTTTSLHGSWNSSHALVVTAPATAAVGSLSRITLVVSDASNSFAPYRAASRISVLVEIVSSSTPSLRILTPSITLQQVSSKSSLLIEAELSVPRTYTGTTVTAYWSLLRLAGSLQDQYTNQTSSVSIGMAGSTMTIPLYILPRSLVLAGRYVFRLQCDSGTVGVDVVVKTVVAPYGGRLMVDPAQQGQGLTNSFLLAGLGWKDVSSAADLPLRYAFHFYANGTWYPIQSASYVRYVENACLPSGNIGMSNELPLRLSVQNQHGAVVHANQSVAVMPALALQTTTGNASSGMVSTYVMQLLSNASEVSSWKLQQVVAALIPSLRTSFHHVLLPQAKRQLLTSMVTEMRSSLKATDEDDLEAALSLLEMLAEDFKDASLAFARSIAPTSSIVRNTTSLQQQLIQAESLLALLQQTILDLAALQEDISSNKRLDTTVLQLVLSNIRITIALSKLLQDLSSNGNTGTLTFLPPISIPGSPNTISVVDNRTSSSGSALVSVAEYDLQMYLRNISSASGTNAAALEKILSNIVSISVAYTSNTSKPVLPIFVANVSLIPGRDIVSTNQAPAVFEYNCSFGVEETVSFMCVDSNVRMNLTCSGRAEAVVKRKCPVPRRVCNVLNLQTASVVSDDYCVAVISSATSVTCRCGFDALQQGKNSSVSLGSIAGPGGAVAVAVMTEFVASDFVNTVSFSGGISGGAVSGDSLVVLFVFGSFWGFGLLLIGLRLFQSSDTSKGDKADGGKRKQRHRASEALATASSYGYWASAGQEEDLLKVPAKLSLSRRTLRHYIVSVLPTVLRPSPWIRRLWQTLLRRQTYLHVLHALWRQETEAGAGSNPHHRRQERRKAALEIAQVLTDLTFSCFILALLYDIQYPNDDGSCRLHVTENACLNRRSPLDPSQTYCAWYPVPPPESAGSIVDIQQGKVLQTVPLLQSSAGDDEEVLCRYLQSEASAQVTVTVAIFASMFSLAMMQMLVNLFDVVDAPSIEDVQVNQRVRDISVARSGSGGEVVVHRGIGGVSMRRKLSVVTPMWDRANTAMEASSGQTFDVLGRSGGSVSNRAAEETPMGQVVDIHRSGESEELVSRAAERASSSNVGAGQTRFGRSSISVAEWWTRIVYFWKRGPAAVEYRAPDVPTDILGIRQRFLRHFGTHSLPRPSYTPDDILAASYECVVGDQFCVMPLSALARASDAEYGVCVLQQFLADQVLTPMQSIGDGSGVVTDTKQDDKDWRAAVTRYFVKILQEEYVSTKAPVTETAKLAATAAIIACNLGALYFVLLKGIQRGVGWQINFLYACLLQWVLEDICVQTLEVLVIDFLLPGMIYRSLQERSVLPLLQLVQVLLPSQSDVPTDCFVPSELTYSAMQSFHLMRDRLTIPECQLLHRYIHVVRDSKEGGFNLASTSVPSRMMVLAFVRLSHVSLETQRLLFSLITSIILGGVLYVWFEMEKLIHGEALQALFVLVLVLIMGWISYTSYRGQLLTIPIPADNGSNRSSFNTSSVAQHPSCERALSTGFTHSLGRVAVQQDESAPEILGRDGRQGDRLDMQLEMNEPIHRLRLTSDEPLHLAFNAPRRHLLNEEDSDNNSALTIISRSYVSLPVSRSTSDEDVGADRSYVLDNENMMLSDSSFASSFTESQSGQGDAIAPSSSSSSSSVSMPASSLLASTSYPLSTTSLSVHSLTNHQTPRIGSLKHPVNQEDSFVDADTTGVDGDSSSFSSLFDSLSSDSDHH